MAASPDDLLRTYRRKRDFAKTPEPAPGATSEAGARPRFVVQRHVASRLHYDFRLEWHGVLKSWAVPRGPSRDPAAKRLAVQTEDHPLEYADFAGDIPAGEYGGGHVDLWDGGTWTPEGDPETAWRAGRLSFELHGRRLRGRWHLVRTRARKGPAEWQLIKAKDAHVVAGDDAEANGAAEARAGTRRAQARATPSAAPRATSRAGSRAARAGRLPAFVEPQLATLASAAPAAGDWLYELKLDGYRLLCRVDGGDVRVVTRNGKDWTARVPRLASALAALGLRGAWLDGELIAPDAAGHASFQRLQQRIGAGDEGLQYHAFDAPFLDGEDLRGLPTHERKARLERALGTPDANGPLRYSRHLQGPPRELWREACGLGLEGLIVKDAGAPYVGGRSGTWLKLKCRAEQEFVVGGYSLLEDGRPDVSNLVLGYCDRGRLRYAGKVGTGFTLADARALKRRFAPARRASTPFADRVPVRGRETVTWLEPRFVAQVAFAGWTDDDRVRAPVFLGLREDKDPAQVVRERAVPVAASTASSSRASRTTAKPASKGAPKAAARTAPKAAPKAAPKVPRASPMLTSPERVLFPDDGITKRELAAYYAAVAPRLLPHLAGRPLSLVRATDDGRPFFQKHHRGEPPPGLSIACIDLGTGGRRDHLVCEDATGLASLAQLGAVELHTWGSSTRAPLAADRLTFDLDPDPALDWRTVADAALVVRALLRDLGLETFCKTTGGKGLHVVAPLTGRRPPWDRARGWARRVAEFLADSLPERFVAEAGAERRRGRIFVDYLRNYGGATAVAAWSPRLRPGAPVSMPLAWRDLEGREDLRGTRWTLRGLVAAKLPRDPWTRYARVRQALDDAALARLGRAR
jgi:bifunctional non-homologous end joining protein LigD